MPEQAIAVSLPRLCSSRLSYVLPAMLRMSKHEWRVIVSKGLAYTLQAVAVFVTFVQEC
jgi:hypothetical protein